MTHDHRIQKIYHAHQIYNQNKTFSGYSTEHTYNLLRKTKYNILSIFLGQKTKTKPISTALRIGACIIEFLPKIKTVPTKMKNKSKGTQIHVKRVVNHTFHQKKETIKNTDKNYQKKGKTKPYMIESVRGEGGRKIIKLLIYQMRCTNGFLLEQILHVAFS